MSIQNRRKPVKVVVTGTKLVSEEYTIGKARRAARLFELQHGIPAETVGGRKVIGKCFHTGRIILKDDEYYWVSGGDDVPPRLKPVLKKEIDVVKGNCRRVRRSGSLASAPRVARQARRR